MGETAAELWSERLRAFLDDSGSDGSPDRAVEAALVRELLEVLRRRAPGRSVEFRVPPYGAVQLVAGTSHRRGTPPAVVECDPATFLALAAGDVTWSEAAARGGLEASGQRSDVSNLLPLVDV